MSEDDMSLTPEYRFEWENGTARETTDPSFTSAQNVPPEAIEHLAELGREDPECTVILMGFGN